MIVIYREVAAQERRNNQHRFSLTSTTTREASSRSRNTIAARNRAVAYSLSWLLSWSTFFAIIFIRVVLTDEHMMPFLLILTNHLLYPLQGANKSKLINEVEAKHLSRQSMEITQERREDHESSGE
jgi:hypothetical protein